MSVKNIRGVVLNASKASLFSPIKVRGVNTYTFGTNVLAWDSMHSYTLSTVAETFGDAIHTQDAGQLNFRCGNAVICPFDFGLLFSCFTAINSAYIEQGESITTLDQDTTIEDIDIAWFGNNAIIYCCKRNLIIPVKATDIKKLCSNQKVSVSSFTESKTYTLTRERFHGAVTTELGEHLCTFPIPDFVQRTYPHLFDEDPANDRVIDDPNTPWDESSGLGSLIASSVQQTGAEATLAKYATHTSLESVVMRTDLMCEPTKRYTDVKDFLGSLCYTDDGAVALAVNFRNSMFVYQPWFTGDVPGQLRVSGAPRFDKFYNVTEECERIERFANTVTERPLTSAQLDIAMFDRIKEAFYEMSLPRIRFANAFGRVVIPEPVLMEALRTAAGETVYCIVPVGSIGTNVICKTASGNLEAKSSMAWGFDDYLFDITEVVK